MSLQINRERFFVSEIIREKILSTTKKEIPYSVEIIVNSFKEEEKILRIQADIITERETQKGIIIGHKGEALKKTGIMARKELKHSSINKFILNYMLKLTKIGETTIKD